jgi:hypothetical protein
VFKHGSGTVNGARDIQCKNLFLVVSVFEYSRVSNKMFNTFMNGLNNVLLKNATFMLCLGVTSLGLQKLDNSMTSRPSSTISVQVSNDAEDRNIAAVEDKSFMDDITTQLTDNHDDGMIDNPDVSMSEEARTDSDIGEENETTMRRIMKLLNF